MTAFRAEVSAADDRFVAEVRLHWPVMSRVATRLAGESAADDVLQNAFTIAWRRRTSYDAAKGHFRAWLLAITADQAQKAFKSENRRWSREAPRDEVHQGQGTAECRVDLRETIKSLPRRQREAICLYYYADLPIAEIGQILGCSPGTVKSTLSDARTALKARLGDDY